MNKTFFDYNYHTHTKRCGHAFGEDEEYVQAALEAGFKRVGFSDHVMLPGVIQPRMRGDYFMLDDYCNSIRSLAKKYEGQIEIVLGFECEWLPSFKDYYHDLLSSSKVDYLIMGQHFYECCDRLNDYGGLPSSMSSVRTYVNDVIDGINSGLFTYVCHPDWFVRWLARNDIPFEGEVVDLARELCLAAKEHGLPLEINMGQSRIMELCFDDEPQINMVPHTKFWKIVKEVGNDVVLGVDAHKPSHFLETDYELFKRFLKKFSFELTDLKI